MIGFLLGAGFSKAMHEDMPLMGDLIRKLNLDGVDVPFSIQNDLEQALSYLWTNHPWISEIDHLRNQAKYLELTNQIHEILSNIEYKSWMQIKSKDDWKKDLARIMASNDHSVVVTMNYDTLLERLMVERLGWKAAILYPVLLQRLDSWSQYRPISSSNELPLDLPRYYYPNLFKLHGSLSWYSMDPLDPKSVIYSEEIDHTYADRHKPNTTVFNTLSSVIVPPVADKSSLYANKVLRSQWIDALAQLHRCNEIYCIGYSFPKSDYAMTLFLAEACSKVEKVNIVNPHRRNIHSAVVEQIFPKNAEVKYIEGYDCVKKMADPLIEKYGKEVFKFLA